MKNFIKKRSSQIEQKMERMTGFTLIELLVVIALVGAAAGALVPAVRS